MWARTDLWEPGASNRLGPPGLRHFRPRRLTDIYPAGESITDPTASVARICEVLTVSRSNSCCHHRRRLAWHQRPPCLS